MMAWKKLSQFPYMVNAGIGLKKVEIPVAGYDGKRLRITIEEEVKECCETWRNGNSTLVRFTHRSGGQNSSFSEERYIPTHCPDCGEKL